MVGGGRQKSADEIRRYGIRVIGLHWLFIITTIPLIITGIMMIRDWVLHTFKIMGWYHFVPTFEGAETLHVVTGILVLLIGLVHILAHIFQRRLPILPKDTFRDLASALHTVLYIFFLVKKDERGAADKYKGNQRITYISTVYTIGLTGLTSLFVMLHPGGEIGLILHMVSGILVALLGGYRILYLLRTHDPVAMRCILYTGTMPEWYVKKNHFLWYREIKGGYSAPPELDFDLIRKTTHEEVDA